RPIDPQQLASARRADGLYRIEWSEIPVPSTNGAPPEVVMVRAGGEPTQDGIAESARAECARVLALLKDWLSDERAVDTRLAIVTRGAVAAIAGESPDLVAAPVWGLVRSAQAEHPGRFVLVDSAGDG